MPISDIPILSMLRDPHAVASGAPAGSRRERRQRRHAELPRARPRAAEFRAGLPAASLRSRAPIRAISSQRAAARNSPPTATARYEVRPRGNAVTHEDEMMKVAANQMDYEAVTSLYTHSLALIKLAIGALAPRNALRSAETACVHGLHQIAHHRRLRPARAGRPHAHHLREHRQLPIRWRRRPAAIRTGAAS